MWTITILLAAASAFYLSTLEEKECLVGLPLLCVGVVVGLALNYDLNGIILKNDDGQVDVRGYFWMVVSTVALLSFYEIFYRRRDIDYEFVSGVGARRILSIISFVASILTIIGFYFQWLQ